MTVRTTLSKALWPTTRCVICGEGSSEAYPGLCAACLERMVTNRDKERFCSRCGSFYPTQFRTCPHCFLKDPTFPKNSLFCAMPYDEDNATLVKKLKYNNRRDLAETMVKLFLRFAEVEGDFDAVTAVPVHKNRYRQRGYNQSAVLGKLLGEALAIPYIETLVKTRDTSSQTGLTLQERKKNPLGAFAVGENAPFLEGQGQRFLLVDDVLTTGATAGECRKVLKAAGAKSVAIAVFAAGLSREGR